MMKVLVTAATKYGATGEVARTIGEVDVAEILAATGPAAIVASPASWTAASFGCPTRR